MHNSSCNGSGNVEAATTTTGPPSSGSGSPAYGMTPEQASREFDSLRREATKLERHLEDRVARYQQLAQRLTVGDGGNNGSGGPSDDDNNNNNTGDGGFHSQRSSLLDQAEAGIAGPPPSSSSKKNRGGGDNGRNVDEEEAALSTDIRRTMSSMTELINTRMAPAAERTGRSQHSLLVKRYREILFDCNADYSKTSAAVARRREARELFRGIATAAGGGGGDASTEQLLRERNAIDSSMKSANSVLNQAASVRSELRTQGASLRGVTGTMARIAGNVPGLNGLISMIQKKRQQDDRVVGGVVAACILFTMWYLFG